jgi:acyl-CoA reductase-like NAD-dependent aldehyde dehydrogenase
MCLCLLIDIQDPSAKETTMGSLISQEHRAKVEYYIKLAQEEGGKIATGGKR